MTTDKVLESDQLSIYNTIESQYRIKNKTPESYHLSIHKNAGGCLRGT
jgi:hypothetical protein